MMAIESSHDDALAQVSRALTMLEKVRVRWRRYADTTPLASTAEPIERALRSTKDAFAAGAAVRSRESLEALPRAIMALRVMKRDELSAVIESTQAAYDAALTQPRR